jgi:heptosyltransferase-2
VAPGAEECVREVLRSYGIAGDGGGERPIVGMSPGAAFGSAKRWLPERFAAVADYVAQHYQAQVVAVGSKGERPICEEVARRAKTPVAVLSGLFPLRGVIALCGRLRLFVTNDSGNMHIAAARATPIVAIFGPTDWRITAPYHPGAIIVRSDTPCAPCLLRECPPGHDHECMRAVTVDNVIAAVDRQMERKA